MDNPWGAPDDDALPAVLVRPPSPKVTPSFGGGGGWGGGDDDASGWGAAVNDYVPGAFGSSTSALSFNGVEVTSKDIPVEEAVGSSFSANDGAVGWGAGSPELPRLSGTARQADGDSGSGFAPSPPLPPVSFAPSSPPSLPLDASDAAPSSSPPSDEPEPAVDEPEEEDDGRGWGGAGPDDLDLPPIASLRIASSSSSNPAAPPDSSDRDAGWVDPAESGWEPPEIPLPLPSFGDAFEKKGRESQDAAADGEEAWGSSRAAEERERKRIEEEREREEERQRKELEEMEARMEEENRKLEAEAAAARPSLFASISSKLKRDAAPTSARSSIEAARPASASGSAKGHAGDEFDLDAPAKAAPKSSWWAKKSAEPSSQPEQPKPPAEEEDPRSLGVEEVKQGESGRTESPEPQPGAVGRFLSRWKRPASAPADGEQQQQQQSQPRSSGDRHEFKADDFDVLARGGIGKVTLGAGVQGKRDEDDEDDEPAGFFGSRPSRLAQAPPEDDFGGLLGALSSAPVKPVSRPVQNKAFDPFDPLSDNFGAVPAPTVKPASVGRSLAPPVPSASLHRPSTSDSTSRPFPTPAMTPAAAVSSFPSLAAPHQPASSSASPMDDSFDAFFDSVAASTGHVKPPVSVAPPPVLAPTPRTRPAQPPLLNTASAASRSSLVSPPPPRIANMSPPARSSTTSPASSIGRASTPILPLAPPPPPSQPLASSRGSSSSGPINIAPPPPSSSAPPVQQRIASPFSAAPLAPVPATTTGGALKSGQPQQRELNKGMSGPLSLDDLSFFES
ncbi:hypothetical protein JCM8547_007924 [Rhodosporidiobolus lusitaniae]